MTTAPTARETILETLTAATAELNRVDRHRLELIRSARALGIPLRPIADAVGASPQHIANITKGDT